MIERRRDPARPEAHERQQIASTRSAARARRARRAPARTGTWHDRTLGTPSTSHSHQPHWPVEHISPRARWKRKLRDRIGWSGREQADRERLAFDAFDLAAVEREA